MFQVPKEVSDRKNNGGALLIDSLPKVGSSSSYVKTKKQAQKRETKTSCSYKNRKERKKEQQGV